MTGTYAVQRKRPCPGSPRISSPVTLRAIYPEVVSDSVELRQQGKAHMEVCEALNRLGYRTRTNKRWRHPQQIIKLLRSFGGSE